MALVIKDAGTSGVDAGNSSTTALAGGATFAGVATKNADPDLCVTMKCDADCTLYVDFSVDDGVTYDTQIPFSVSAGVGEFHVLVKGPRTHRVRVVNGSSAMSYMRLEVATGTFRSPNKALKTQTQQDDDAIVTRDDGEEAVMRKRVRDEFIIAKYGKNADVDAAEDIWDGGGDYTGFPTSTAEELQVLSSDVNDTSAGTGARQVRIYYLNASYVGFDSSGEYLYTDVTLNGTTAVNTGITAMRVWRVKVISSGSGATNAGIITVRWRTTTSVIFAAMPIGAGQAWCGAFTVPAGFTGYIKRFDASMDDNTSNRADMALKIREFGTGTYRLTRPFLIATDRDYGHVLYGGIELPAKTDVVFRATSVANTNGVIAVSYGIRLTKD